MGGILFAKKTHCVLACLIMFQSVSLRADIKDSISMVVNQLRESFLSSDLLKDKQLLAAIAFFSVCMGYSWYVKNRGSKNKPAPSLITNEKDSIIPAQEGSNPLPQENATTLVQDDSLSATQDASIVKNVTRVEEILKLNKVTNTGSYGCMDPCLLIRAEAIRRVLYASIGSNYITLQPDQLVEMNRLLEGPLVKKRLILNQEKHLGKELESAKDIWGLNTYAEIARKKLGLSPLKKNDYGIGTDGLANPGKKEAYEKLDEKGRYEVAFEVFTRNMFSTNSPQLAYWQENSIHFKESLQRIHTDLAAPKKK